MFYSCSISSSATYLYFFIHHHSHLFRHCVVCSQDSKSHDGKCLLKGHQLQHEFFSIGDEVFTESSLQQTFVGKSENSLHISEGTIYFQKHHQLPARKYEGLIRYGDNWVSHLDDSGTMIQVQLLSQPLTSCWFSFCGWWQLLYRFIDHDRPHIVKVLHRH